MQDLQDSPNYPIGIQDFEKLREEKFLYVDKTELIHRLVRKPGRFFLSRPRRFGKSLLLSTIKALFEGKQELFENLWISKHWDFNDQHPTLLIQLNELDLRNMSLEEALVKLLHNKATEHGLTLEYGKNAFGCLLELIQNLCYKYNQRIVLLIDNCDMPVVDFLDQPEKAVEHLVQLHSFYRALKPANPFLHFLLLTGVLPFSIISIPGLENLQDISLDARFANLTGVTQQELQHYFEPEIAALSRAQGKPDFELLEEIKRWYNGYSWDGNERVYNPFSLLNFFAQGGIFKNFWFATGTPKWLIKEVYNRRVYDYQGLEINENGLTQFDLGELSSPTLLFQTGYLTIRNFYPQSNLYQLDYPNLEVQQSFYEILLGFYCHSGPEVAPLIENISNLFAKNDLNGIFSRINQLFATIPHELWQKENEHFYHALIHLTFNLLGAKTYSEVHTSNGRCDALVETADRIFVFEFKLDQSAEVALAQIYDRDYSEAFRLSEKEIVSVGVSFSRELKAVEGWKVEIRA
jgi:hypothetical protein